MSYSVALPHRLAPPRRLHRGRLAGFLLGFLLAILGFALAGSALRLAQTPSQEGASAAPPSSVAPAPELPREWRYSPPGVEYEHMYRHHDSPRLDWIRER